jgi:hypothetical protein
MSMRRIRQIVSCLALTTTLSASIPCLAESGSSAQASKPANTAMVHSESKLDFSRFPAVADLSSQGPASSDAPLPAKVQMQTSGGGSGMSTAKKTWIIVGSVVGAALIVAAVSNSGDGNGGGGY